jgi:hypothetical protein
MKQTRIFPLLAVLILTGAALGQGTKRATAASGPQAQQLPQPAPTVASTVDREISTVLWRRPKRCRKISSISLLRA